MKWTNDIAAVVTGGGSGLGAATARRLAGLGAKVALFDLNAEAGAAVADEIGGLFCNVDVTSTDSLAEGFAAARAAHGQERILVACAGIAPGQKTVSRGVAHDPGLFAKTLAINLGGTFNAAAQSAAGIATLDSVDADGSRGVIVMTASVAGIEGQVGQAAYAASKGGVIGLTLPMARDLADKGIRVVTIAPGLFETPMMAGLPDDVRDALGGLAPFPARLAKPDEYAQMVQQIVENDMLNGTVIRLDGAIRLPPR
ncbi:3-hydroxy-2-methylbutyryl-CoA dehydrogenase [Actibacterium mucosum KCTC 23349]|uniref:3-hydroxy-2-methylbutyryl-CoA dehydrogenase n=1 Tax=Actibacterium mucosum KCTC 23349 TaxID=1454373 RepID=A0A037ZE30_9RHOB|nr:SDR family NAD(P)-dependent oxidoreductase [Actibacterium mucosum]KAJ54372.1 3-hydroxy-2-methylbutyryl-CoA dehydrogenase [Actibacterium mucosum KCTC 23349]